MPVTTPIMVTASTTSFEMQYIHDTDIMKPARENII